MRRKLAIVAACLAVLALVGGVWLTRWVGELEERVEARFAGRLFAVPSRVYSGSLLLYPGLDVERAGLVARLRHLNYHAERDGRLEPGEFRRSGARIEVHLRPFDFPHRRDPGGRLNIYLDDGGRVQRILDPQGRDRAAFELEPEIIASLHGPGAQDRRLVSADDVAPELLDAILAIEDQAFYTHGGLHLRRILGAAWANLRAGRVEQGGSTLTQQLVKNLFLTRERKFSRKLTEAVMALILERNHDKREILDAYLNEVYLGQRGAVGIHGVGEAAYHYFAKRAGDLTLAESALLAGMIKGASYYSPRRHVARARRRRDLVLRVMLDRGDVGRESYAEAIASDVTVVDARLDAGAAPYFVEHLRGELVDAYGEELLHSEGLAVFTTLDPELQRAARTAVDEGLTALERGWPDLERTDSPLQAAVIALAPRTGDVLAMVGGRSFGASQFNRATQARRQPGSVFKPIVALAAFTAKAEPPFTAATLLEDSPLEVGDPARVWRPRNYDGTHRGPVSLRRAVEESLNVPIARLGLAVGPDHILRTARRMGVRSPLEPLPSISLGAFEMTPLEAASAYAVLAAGGLVPVVRGYTEVVKADGAVLEHVERDFQRAFGRAPVHLVTSLLQGSVDRGTAKRLRALGFSGDLAGKTGTSSDYRDAWFIGYTPDVVVAVWVGFDDGHSIGLPGSAAALPIFARVMETARGKRSGPRFVEPPGLEHAAVDPASGLLAAVRCPGADELFLTGTAPTRTCTGGAPRDGPLKRLADWWKGL